MQSIRTDDYKFIRNLTLGIEEYYDLKKDPLEKNNIIGKVEKEKIINLRKKLNIFLKGSVSQAKQFSKKIGGKLIID